MPRLYIPSIPRDEKALFITGEESRYLLNVLRMKAGDEFAVFDSSGGHFKAEIKRIGRNGVVAELREALPPASEPVRRLVLLQGILKGRQMDYVVQKATELGVDKVVPLVTVRSQVRQTRKHERWQKIALEASRQSFRTTVPDVTEPVALGKFLEGAKSLTGYIFWEQGGSSLRDAAIEVSDEPFVVAIGPEGGFTGDEVELAREKGLDVKSLGSRILRAETATVSAVTIVQFLLGEMG
jgi:16S rRNA (uracil1498-N3)-methyltransferase